MKVLRLQIQSEHVGEQDIKRARPARASRDQLAGVPEDRVAVADLVRGKLLSNIERRVPKASMQVST